MTKLTPRALRFVDEYLVDLCAKDAAIRAGYAPKQAKCSGCRLLADERIQELVRQKQGKLSSRLQVTAADALSLVVEVARSEPGKWTSGDITRARIKLAYGLGALSNRLQVIGTISVVHRPQLLERISAALAAAQPKPPELPAPIAQA
jgi:hypothetical protein